VSVATDHGTQTVPVVDNIYAVTGTATFRAVTFVNATGTPTTLPAPSVGG
jgi:hypothetical protein